ncbi:MAG: cytochrome c3 family protein [Candidatus Eisenbacteria bacterium]
MKRLGLLLGAFALLIGVPLAMAGDFHTGTTLVCADCHVMHYSQTHGYNEDGTGIYAPLGASGPYEALLRNDVNDLCLTCHNNTSFAPDVLGANSNSYVREAGGLNRNGSAPYYHATGHTLDATDVAPGGTWSNTNGLSCTDCHHQHGAGGAYRNLRVKTGTAPSNSTVTYAIGTNDLTKDIFERATTPMTSHYAYNNVDWNEPDQTASKYAMFCKGCHTNFHGAKGGPEVGGDATGAEWLRHPNADANIGGLTGGHSSLTTFTSRTNRVHVMSPTGVWDPPPSGVTPSCMSCHKAHGNKHAFGLIFMKGTGTVSEEGDDGVAVKDLCKQCHIQG